MRIVGLDIGNRIAVACCVDLEVFTKYPHTEANALFDLIKFDNIELSRRGLEILTGLKGDIYVYEPTGNYHRVWTENLENLGLTYYQVSNNKLGSYRTLLEFPKDDPHDALALCYYFKDNKDNPKGFLRVRDNELQMAYELLFERERMNNEIRPLQSRTRNLLHAEFPEYCNKRYNGENVWGLWEFIATGKTQKKCYQLAFNHSIGSARRNGGFSTEVRENAEKLMKLQQRKLDCKQMIQSIIYEKRFKEYHKIFDQFHFGDILRAIILCQIYPFDQFIDESGNEIRRLLVNKQTSNGNGTTKRIAYRRFHSLLGKGIKRKQSGQVDIKYVTGSKICRNLLTLWVGGAVINPKLKHFTAITSDLLEKYYNDVNASTVELEKLKTFSNDDLKEVKPELRTLGQPNSSLRRIGELLATLIERVESKKDPTKSLSKEGNKILHQWAKARVSDKAIKLLFKAFIVHWKQK